MREYFGSMFDDRYGFPGYFSLHCCPTCGQLQTVPLLIDKDLPALYSNFYPRREIDIGALQRAVGNPGSFTEAVRRWMAGTDNQGQYVARPGMAVLDYGCGAGQSLLELKKLGAEAYGLEADPNVQQVADALGLRIHIGTIDDNPFPGVMFDLIVLNQVLEHIPLPERLLTKLASRLRAGAVVVFSVPNCASFYRHYYDRSWINWHVPYHLHHFNPNSIRRFFSRHGWRVASLRTVTPNLWTILQIRAAVECTKMGVPNPMWTGQAHSEEDKRRFDSVVPSRLKKMLYDLVLSANRPVQKIMFPIWNRSIDATGYGDSILVVAKPEPSK